jgi:hypothetical protein
MGKWADSLPTIDREKEPLETSPPRAALYIGQTIYLEATSGSANYTLSRAELAAAHLRAWRKSLPPQTAQQGWCEDEHLIHNSDALDRGFLLTIALYHLTSVLRWGVPEDSLTPLRDAEKALKIYIKRARETKAGETNE